ncbi:unnamed protein product [Nezara viridula]|uniref:Uncharacterized protein n=1 Tax=Nezara viridula TaxID=85310 RepID=A0A9P0DXR5_NEZVI|nr:unnamed protein product [Nezara viridula]
MATRVTTFLSKPISKKLIEAVNFGYKNSKGKYSENLDRVECIMILALFYCFLKRDLAFYYILQDMMTKIDAIKYSDFCWWLWSNFKFGKDDVIAVLSFANDLARKGELRLPQHVLAVFIDLHNCYSDITSSEATKYFSNKEERRLDKTNFSKQVIILNQRTKYLLVTPIYTKIVESVKFANGHKISEYPLYFDLEQNMILTLFYGLLRRDVALCVIIQDMMSNAKVDYDHLFEWLNYTFEFDKHDVECAVMFGRHHFLEQLKHSDNFLLLFLHLENKYFFDDFFHLEETSDVLDKLRLDPNSVKNHFSHSWLPRYKSKENRRSDIRSKGKITPLHIAASLGDDSAVRLLSQHYQPTEALDSNSSTPLHEAVKGLHFETVRVLLELGVSDEIKDSEGLTPVEIARRKKSQAMLKLFDNHSKSTVTRSTNPDLKSINERDNDGRTALHILAGYGMAEEVERFLKLGAYPNVRDKKGMTPSHYAIRSGNQETINLLSSAIGTTKH